MRMRHQRADVHGFTHAWIHARLGFTLRAFRASVCVLRVCSPCVFSVSVSSSSRVMGKLLKKYARGRGLPENAEHTARTFDAARAARAEAKRRESGAGTSSSARGKTTTTTTTTTKTKTKKWSSRGGAKPRLMRALRASAHGHRALTAREVEACIAPVLQPIRAKYGGQGLAKTSTYVNIASETFLEEFTVLFDEHVDGFNGKSYVKMGKAQEDMLWKRKLREKRLGGGGGGSAAAREPTAGTTTSAHSERESAIAAYRALKAKRRGGGAQTKKPPGKIKW